MFSFTRFLISSSLTSVLLISMAPPASASLITSTADLPPNGVYLSPQDVHTTYAGAALTLLLNQVAHKPFACRSFIPGTALHCREAADLDGDAAPDEVENFLSELTGTVTIQNNPFSIPVGTTAPFSMFGPVQTVVFDKFGVITGSFDTEMLAMDLQTTIGGLSLRIRESPTLRSLGHTSIDSIGGGLFRIDSFFDVFTEISVDNGAWIPSDGATRVTLVPEPGTTLLLLSGMLVMLVQRLSGSKSRRREAMSDQ